MAQQGDRLTEAKADFIVASTDLKVVAPVTWTPHGSYVKSVVPVQGPGVNADLVLDLGVSSRIPGKYTYQLRQRGGIVLRRLDVRGTHTNDPATGNAEVWHGRTHKHRYRDNFEDSFAYTPTDIPPTTAPARTPDPDEHRDVFKAFCTECGIDEAGMWTPPPLP